MLYLAVRAVHRGYALTLFWVYVGLFLLAFLLMFVLPLATIALLFLAIFGLAVAYLGKLVLAGTENLLARRAFRRSTCPSCRGHLAGGLGGPAGGGGAIVCIHCDARFEPCGTEIEDGDGVDRRVSTATSA